MHGVKRDDQACGKSEEQVAAELAKVNTYKKLIKDLSLAETPDQVLTLSKTILLLNPESYQTWNLRKKALLKVGMEVAREELLFSVETIKLNPKSYCSWFHRKWLITDLMAEVKDFDHKQELRLCGKLLALDSRNCTIFMCLF
jgi:hypothetical protein